MYICVMPSPMPIKVVVLAGVLKRELAIGYYYSIILSYNLYPVVLS